MSKHITLDNLGVALPPIKHLIDKKAEGVDWNENDPAASGYIRNRTHYKGIYNETILPATDIVFEENWGSFEYDTETNYTLINGETYLINFDGTEYNCVAYEFNNGEFVFYVLGNLYLGDMSDINTGEPFCIFIDNGYLECCISYDESTTLSIEISGNVQIIHKIPEEYLPKMVGKFGVGLNAEVFNNGIPSQASGEFSHAEGNSTTASGFSAHAEGIDTTASGDYAHAEGRSTIADGRHSHTEGWLTRTGNQEKATSPTSMNIYDCSHAEGCATLASGMCSHAEGMDSVALGRYSHAEGYRTSANANYSHTEGIGTIAAHQCQHVYGSYNIEDTSAAVNHNGIARGKYIAIVGNGTSTNARYNAHTLDWNGVGWFAGGLKVGGTGQDDENAKTIATEEYVDQKVADATTNISITAITDAEIEAICGATIYDAEEVEL